MEYANQELHCLFEKKNSIKPLLKHIGHGIEKEGLRITSTGKLAQSNHPQFLGSALTHPYITTDYSEALLELITPVFTSISALFAFLDELHRYTAKYINPDMLWVNSMPMSFTADDKIPIANYGDSNYGKMKHIYRLGLSYRYGQIMQTIAGIHYNFSLPEKYWFTLADYENISAHYFGMIRNFKRYNWLLIYLFGASPAIHKNFITDHVPEKLQKLGDDTLYLPWGTSLRMSDIGYTNKIQESLQINYNNLADYIKTLVAAMNIPYEPYIKIGIKKNGKYQQLNTNLLQIENEYYSTIRPKRVTKLGEKPLQALHNKGVEYVEIRCIDINPFESYGISIETACFLDVFLLFCAFTESPEIQPAEYDILQTNWHTTVHEGRKPDAEIYALVKNTGSGKNIKKTLFTDYGHSLLNNMMPIAELLDNLYETKCYRNSLDKQIHKIKNSMLTPSAQVIKYIHKHDNCFAKAMLVLSKKHHLQSYLSKEREEYFLQLAEQSILKQQQIEQAETENFDTFLHNYFISNNSIY